MVRRSVHCSPSRFVSIWWKSRRPPSDLIPHHPVGWTAVVMAVAAPPRDDIISGGRLRDLLHLPCHRMEGDGGERVLDEGEVWGGGWAGTSRRSPMVEVTDCSPAVSSAWPGPARPAHPQVPVDTIAQLFFILTIIDHWSEVAPPSWKWHLALCLQPLALDLYSCQIFPGSLCRSYRSYMIMSVCT